MFKRFLFCSFILASFQSRAQYFLSGVEPFGTKWRQIKTETFTVIFPSDALQTAIRYANLLSVTDSITPKNLHAIQKPFDVVIHNHNVLSNGFVAWAPKRMEIISQFPTSTYAQPWLTQLALHETRHTSQMYKLNSGLIRPATFLLGEHAIGLAAGFVPFWFLEGDAVAFETAASNSGRGRQADFYQYYRAHRLSDQNGFKYDKWLMGSYKNNIPNHYSFGYQLVSYAKVKYGDEVWANTLQYVSRNPYTIFPFYFGLKKQTGLSRRQLYEKTFANLDSIWTADQKSIRVERPSSLVKKRKEDTDYRYPFRINDSTIIAYKSNLSNTSRFVLVEIKTQKEKTILQPGYLTGRPFYYKENIFWTEYKQHLRWDNVSYSILKWFNITKGETKVISDRGHYFSPVYNPISGLVLVISANSDGSSSIEAFNLAGRKVRNIPIPQYFQPFELFISTDKNDLFAGVVSDKGKSIVKVNSDETFTTVYGPTYRDIHSLSSNGSYIFFSTSNGYKEDLFSLNIGTKEVSQVTFSEFGSTDPSYSSAMNTIIYSNYTPNGYTIAENSFDSINRRTILNDVNNDWISERLTTAEKCNIDSISIPNNQFKVERYHGIKRYINVHSWAPFFFDPTLITTGQVMVKPGVSIFSQNLTGTSVLSAGYGYDSASLVHLNYQYFGLYPVFSFSFDLSGSSPLHYINNTIAPNVTESKKESTFSAYLPLTLSSGRFSTMLYPIVQLVSSNEYFLSVSDSLYHKGFNRLNYGLYFSTIQRMAPRDVRPRLGFVANLEFEHAPFNRNNFGSVTSGTFSLYLPGVVAAHSLMLTSSLQNQKIKRYDFSNRFIAPRGYQNFDSEKFRSVGINYLFPFAYPDFSIGSLAYIKRFSFNSFFDYAKNSTTVQHLKQTEFMKSMGFEIFTDIKLLRTRYPIRLMYQQGWMGSNLLPFNTFSVYIDFYGQ
jgi:hypothetical protein